MIKNNAENNAKCDIPLAILTLTFKCGAPSLQAPYLAYNHHDVLKEYSHSVSLVKIIPGLDIQSCRESTRLSPYDYYDYFR
jgi:hypothetical protein